MAAEPVRLERRIWAPVSLLAAASLVADYVLTVAVSLAAGAASLASAFPSLQHRLLAICLAGLIVITTVNLWGIAESARVLMLPMAVFLAAIFGVIIVGLVRSHPAAVVGTVEPVRVSEVAVLITEVQPRRWRYRILQNQRGLLLATVLRASTDGVICTIPYQLTTR
jgi:amino acid transporter